MIERYHLVMAAVALAAGTILALVDRRRVRGIALHAVAAACALGAVLALLDDPSLRGAPWIVAAGLLAGVPDRDGVGHPLGRWVLPMAVLSLVGVWASVPDTQAPLAAGAALAPLAVLHARRGRSVGPPACAALVVAVLGSVWVGSAGWGAALVEVVLVAQVLVAPLVLGFAATPWPSAVRRALVVAHVVVVVALPRWVMWRSVPVAVAAAGGALLASAAVAASSAARWPRSGVRPNGTSRWSPRARPAGPPV